MAIIFIFLILYAWYLYLRGKKVYALLIFYFFASWGFQIIPEETMSLMPGFSKGQDYALILIGGCVGFDFLFVKGRYFKRDTFSVYLLLFFAFLLACVLYSRFTVGCSWSDILRVSRLYMLFVSYFVFRNMTKEELNKLLNIIYHITIIQSCIYILQVILSVEILNTMSHSVITIGDWKIMRYYNQPLALYFAAFMSIYNPPSKGLLRVFAIVVFSLSILLGFNRSSTGLFVLALFLGYILRLPKVKQINVTLIAVAIMIPVIAVVGHNFVKSRTYQDFKAVAEGRFADANVELYIMYNSTFAYRVGHLFERIHYLDENPQARLMGPGLIAEDSPMAGQFNFILGLQNTSGNIYQLETSDITYSVLLIRFGYLGTVLFVMMYFYMIYFFFKKRSNKHAFASFLFMFLTLGVSFFSSNLMISVYFIIPLLMMNLINKEMKSETDSIEKKK
ncbi:MAG: hypothetical protein LBJ72_11595 [Dysgonamonadaceae bacterium]|jgi:hypothetical protein|nr:hypothetical protein [Dysgonamonadaceae bacterium]